ncbi:MAG: flagellar protein FlgN [Bacillota bacterium]
MVKQLIKILQAEYQIYQQLYQLGQDKKETIIDNRVDDLLSIIEEEEDKLRKIQTLEEKRIAKLEEIIAAKDLEEGFTFAELVAVIDEPKKSKLKSVRADLLELLTDLEELNDRNANLIQESLQLNNYTMKLLTGDNIDKNNTYQKSGTAKKNGRSPTSIIDHKA